MQIIELLKHALPDFPLTNKNELQQIINNIQLEITRLNRLKKFAGSADENSNLEEINKQQSILLSLIPKLNDEPQNIIQLTLECDVINATDRLLLWVDYAQSLLKDEPNPLNVIARCSPPENPLEFAGLLIVLLRQKVSPHSIIKSGVLHNYFYIYSFNLELISKLYNYINLVPISDPSYEACQNLINQANAVSCCSTKSKYAIRGFESYSLSGVIKKYPEFILGVETDQIDCYLFNGRDLKYIDSKRQEIKLTISNEDRIAFFSFLKYLLIQIPEGANKLLLNLPQLENIIEKTKYRPTFEKIKIKFPKFIFRPVLKNLHNLYKLFGCNFLTLALDAKSNPRGTEIIKKFISNLTNTELQKLYQFIIDEIPESNRKTKILKKLSSLISIEILSDLSRHANLAWSILYAKPELFDYLNEQELETVFNTPLSLKTFNYAIDILNTQRYHLKFVNLENNFYHTLLAAIVNFPKEIELNPNTLSQLKKYKNITQSCGEYLLPWRKNLKEVILANCNPFNYDSYLNIYQTYQAYKDQAQVLQKINADKNIFPTSNYELKSFILNVLYYHDLQSTEDYTLTDLLKHLDTMHPVHAYSIYDEPEQAAEKAKVETLYNWLAIESDNNIQIKIIEILQTFYHIDNWQEQDFDGKWVFIVGLEHHNINLINRYLKNDFTTNVNGESSNLIHADQILYIDTVLKSKKCSYLLDFAVNDPFWLEYLVPIYPSAILNKYLLSNIQKNNTFNSVINLIPKGRLFEVLSFRNRKDNCVLEHALEVDLTTFQFCYCSLNAKEQILALSATNKNIQNLFHVAASCLDQAKLETFLDLVKGKELFAELIKPDKVKNTFFHILAKRREINFNKILDCFDAGQIELILQLKIETNFSILQILAYENLEQLKDLAVPKYKDLILANLTGHFNLVAINVNIFLQILDLYTVEQQVNILKERNLFSTVFHTFLKGINDSNILFQRYPNEIFDLLKLSNSFGTSSLQMLVDKPEILEGILLKLNAAEKLQLLEQKNQANESILHLAARCNSQAFTIVLNNFPKNKLIHALKQVNQNGESVLKIALDNFDSVNARHELDNIQTLSKILLPNCSQEEIDRFLNTFAFPDKNQIASNRNSFFQAWQRPVKNFYKTLQLALRQTTSDDLDSFGQNLIYHR